MGKLLKWCKWGLLALLTPFLVVLDTVIATCGCVYKIVDENRDLIKASAAMWTAIFGLLFREKIWTFLLSLKLSAAQYYSLLGS